MSKTIHRLLGASLLLLPALACDLVQAASLHDAGLPPPTLVSIGHDTLSFPDVIDGRVAPRRCIVDAGQAATVGGHDDKFGTYVILGEVTRTWQPYCASGTGAFIDDEDRHLWKPGSPASAPGLPSSTLSASDRPLGDFVGTLRTDAGER